LLLDQEKPTAFAQWEHFDAPTYVKGRVCIAGDAAHAMTPWQGSGAAMALEDAVILGSLFAQIDSPDQVGRILNVYDKVRRPRTQRVALSSRITGRILSGIDKEVGLDIIKLHDALKDRWIYIHEFNLDKHIETAIQELENGT
jgi:salicylate hydroxylase